MRKLAVALFVLTSGIALAQSGPPPGDSTPPPGAGGPPPGPGGGGHAIIDSIQFAGDTRFSPAQLSSVLTQHPGEPVSRPGVQADLQALRAMYRQPGGPRAMIKPSISHPAPGHVVITYMVTER